MAMPNLKRVKISSEQDLLSWLARNPDLSESFMLVTNTRVASPTHVSRQSAESALSDHGWVVGRRYTLAANLLGHVVTRQTR